MAKSKRAQFARVVTTDGVDLSGCVTEINLKVSAGSLPIVTLDVIGHLDVDPDTHLITVTVGDERSKASA